MNEGNSFDLNSGGGTVLEFLDLNSIENEQERRRVQHVLYDSAHSMEHLPWKTQTRLPKGKQTNATVVNVEPAPTVPPFIPVSLVVYYPTLQVSPPLVPVHNTYVYQGQPPVTIQQGMWYGTVPSTQQLTHPAIPSNTVQPPEPQLHQPKITNDTSKPFNIESTVSTAAVEQTITTAPAPKTYASLFNSSSAHNNDVPTNSVVSAHPTPKPTIVPCKQRVPVASVKAKERPFRDFMDPHLYRIGECLKTYALDVKTISLKPRGLINKSNYCYINSILQALLACAPVYNLLSKLSVKIGNVDNNKYSHINGTNNVRNIDKYPIIHGLCRFVNEFDHLPAGLRVNRRTMDKGQANQHRNGAVSEGGSNACQQHQLNAPIPSVGVEQAFEPVWLYKIINEFKTFTVEGRQEDAEEFFGCLLNGLNDEMRELIKLVEEEDNENAAGLKAGLRNGVTLTNGDHSTDAGDEEEWQLMGPKNRGSIRRCTQIDKTPISEIFGGCQRIRIQKSGDQPTDNIQPFFTLQLNIEKVKTVREALEALLVARNQLEGVTSSRTNEQVEAWQQITLEELPIILVLHLKCFDFKMDGCTKIVKALEFPIDLKIDTKMLSAKSSPPKEKQYKLFAVVYHDGKEATKGHYITDAFHVGYNSWIRYDDASVKSVSVQQVLNPQGTCVPYLLFYRRSDTIRSK